MHDLISLTKVNGTYCSRGCFRVRLKPVFLLKQRGGKKGGAQRGQTLNQRRFLFFIFFLVFYELTLADVWLYHSQSNSQHCVQLCRASLAPPHPHKARLFTRLHLGESCREFLGGVLGKLLLCLGIPESAQFVLREQLCPRMSLPALPSPC